MPTQDTNPAAAPELTSPPSSQPTPQPQQPDPEHPKPGEPTRGKLHCHNWLADIPGGMADCDMVEVQFKNTRKGYYKNSLKLPLAIGDYVAVEASPGHDIGRVSLTGQLVKLQMAKAHVKADAEVRRVFRKARPADMEKFREAKARENDTMIRSRKIAASLNLKMKIGDVEYQGDGNKAIFYYIADERVDFRQLIKVLAETFRIRIEMKQIGARQEAGRIGGIGPCGRPLCCASWMTNFVSVGTAAARFQDISLNPQKLAGQCAKLKCCLNFEVDAYVECVKKLPSRDITLETADGTWYHFKTDIFKKQITYSSDKHVAANLVTIDAQRAFEVIALNKQGEKPASLRREGDEEPQRRPSEFVDLVGQDSISRFDKKKKKKKKPKADGAAKAAKPAKSDQQQRPAKPDQSDQSDKSDQAEKADTQRQPRRQQDRQQDRQRQPKQPKRQQRPAKADKSDQSDKSDKSDKSDQSKKDSQPKSQPDA